MSSRPPSIQERVAFLLYQMACLALLLPQAVYLLFRSRRSPGYRRHWGERFLGRAQVPPVPLAGPLSPPRLWVHAVSVGEMQAAIPLVRLWLSAGPDHQLMLTHTTVTGREVGAKALGPEIGRRVFQAYLPYDLPWAVERFLRRTRPTLGLLMETELWPQLCRTSAQHGLPLVLVNGRLSERSARRMQGFAWLARPMLQSLRMAVVQAPEHAHRLQALAPGLRVEVCGSMKFDLALQPALVARGQQWRARLGHRTAVLLASSREEEEPDFLAAWVKGRPADSLLILVPRHPERFDRVAGMVESAGLRLARRSDWASDDGPAVAARAEVVLGDSLGEMQAYVAASDCVVVGGSLVPLGGQNPIEACAQGRPVVLGPHMFNFPEIARLLLASGAAQTATTAAEAVRICRQWQEDSDAYATAAHAAAAFAAAHRGASARTLALLQAEGLLPRSSGCAQDAADALEV